METETEVKSPWSRPDLWTESRPNIFVTEASDMTPEDWEVLKRFGCTINRLEKRYDADGDLFSWYQKTSYGATYVVYND